MPCLPLEENGRTVGFACVRGRPKVDPCRWCGAPATRLCDEPVEVRFGAAPRTCDAPMCAAHTTRVAGNADRCPDHVLAAELVAP